MNTKRSSKAQRSNRSKKAVLTKKSSKSGHFEVALSDIFELLLRRMGLLIAAMVMSAGMSAAYFLLSSPKFESEAEILVERRDASLAADGSPSGEGADVSRDLLATHMRIIQSQRNIEDAIVRAKLTEIPSLFEQINEDQTLSDYIANNLYVTSGGNVAASNAHVLNLKFRHGDAGVCKTVLDALVEQYQDFLKQQYEQDSSEFVQLLDDARLELEVELKELEDEYRQFRSTAPVLVSGEETSNAVVQRYEELMAEIGIVESQLAESEARMKLVQEGLKRYEESQVPDIQRLTLIDGLNVERMSVLLSVERGGAETASFQAEQPERMASATSEFTSLLEKRSRLASMTQTFGDNHPEVVSLREQVQLEEDFVKTRAASRSELENKPVLTPESVMDAYVNMLENDLNALRSRRDTLIALSHEVETNVRSLVDYELQAESLIHERLRKQALYDGTVDNLRSIALSSKSGPSLIHAVLRSPEAGKHVEPNFFTAAAIGIFGVLLLGVGLVGVAELSDNSIYKNEELEEIYACPVINNIPDFARDAETRSAMRSVQRSKSKLSKMLVTHHAAESRVAEIFRSLRTHVMFTMGSGAKVICVTSAKPGEGKSTIASNLATAIAQTGRQVLLVDCDMRRPQVGDLMGINATNGLQSVLSGSSDIDDVIGECGIPNLYVITAGKIASNAAELLEGKLFDELLSVVREKFDLVLLDCPPVLPVTDTTIVAQKADKTLMVVKVDPQTRPHSQRVARILDSVSADLVGVVVNRSANIREKYDYYAYGAYRSQNDDEKQNTSSGGMSSLTEAAAI